MKTQRLIILGILKEKPRHGYEIKKILLKDLGIFSPPENKSIYYPLKMMEQEGLIRKTVARDKGKLLRFVYAITARGQKEFTALAMEALRSQSRPFIEIDIPLFFLPHLAKRAVAARLRLRKRFLEKVKRWLAENLTRVNARTAHKQLLLKHHLNLLRAEEKFVGEIITLMHDA